MKKLTQFISSIWGQSLLLLIIWNFVIRLVATFGYFILPEHFAPLNFIASYWKSNFIFWSFANFDGEHYLSIAKYGYQLRNGFPEYAFFPLFPLLVHGLSSIIKDYYLSGMLISQAALYFTLVYIVKWTKELKIPDIRLALLCSTGAIFLASIYTEPLFLMLASMTMYFSEKKWWGRAIFATALATATRVSGVFLALFLFVKLLKSKTNFVTSGIYLFTSLSGFMAYMVYLWQTTGDPMSWYHAQSAWGKATATSPLLTLSSYLRAISTQFVPDMTHLVVVIEVLVTVGAIALFIKMLLSHALDLSYWLYLALSLALPIATGSLGSMPRFVLTMFPLLVVVPTLSRFGKTMYYIFSISILLVGIVLFTRGYWYG
ncbi:MAG: mannosyltransferase family protein [Microgenomates group bacterium]